MKKKIIVIVCIALVLLLFLPVPTGVYKDGGTREYTALTYKIVDWNRLNDAGSFYTGVKVYPFPYNFLSVSRLYEREQRNSDTEEIAFSAKIIRTDLCGEREDYPTCKTVTTRAELMAHYERYREPYQYDGTELKTVFDAYTDEFFAKNVLVLTCIEEGSGSIRHEVESVHTRGGNTYIDVKRTVPEIGTCDMAYWTAVIELPRDSIKGSLTVLVDGVNLHTAPVPLDFGSDFWNIYFKIPKNWEHKETEDGYGIELRPEGEHGYIAICHVPGGFGVCGTGLSERDIKVGPYSARIGSYSDFKNWDFIYLLDTPGDYVIYNKGAYWCECNDALAALFESLQVGPQNAITPAEAEKRAADACSREYKYSYASFDSYHGEYIVRFYDKTVEDGETVFLTYEGKPVLAGGYDETKEYSDNHACYYPTIDYFTDSSETNG